MTPQERDLVAALFERLAGLEAQPRDAEAERLITQGLTSAPHAIYPLVQTVLLQDEALKRANARIEELEAKNSAEPQAPAGGFLDNMRGALFGRGPAGPGDARGSVPSVRPGGVWNNGQAGAGAAPPAFQPSPGPAMAGPAMAGPMGGGSFLGTAAAAAVGTIGGSLLFNGIRNLMGGGHPAAFGNYNDPQRRRPRGDRTRREVISPAVPARMTSTPATSAAADLPAPIRRLRRSPTMPMTTTPTK